MAPTPSTNYLLAIAFGSIFQLWPILLLSPLTRPGGGLGQMLFVWIMVLAMRIFLAVNTTTSPNYASLFHVLPEPTYTLLFGVTGGMLMIFSLLRSYFQERR